MSITLFDETLTPSEIEIRKQLAKIGAKEINDLQNDQDLISVWRQNRNLIDELFIKAGRSISDIGDAFPEFYLDMWTEESWSFNSSRNSGSLVMCLWSLLFYSTFELSGALVHEANHYRYLKCNGMLGKPEPEQEEFYRTHCPQMEIEANEEQIEFLEKIEICFDESIGFKNQKGEQLLCEKKSEIFKKARLVLEKWRSGNYDAEYRKDLSEVREGFYKRGAEFLGIEHLIEKGIPQRKEGFKLLFGI
ncbi:hypothetical protein ACFLQ6_09020 [Thermoproteota archaeon]